MAHGNIYTEALLPDLPLAVVAANPYYKTDLSLFQLLLGD